MNFKQSSYEVMGDRGEVTVMVDMNRPSSEPFEVMISSMDVTANGKSRAWNKEIGRRFI